MADYQRAGIAGVNAILYMIVFTWQLVAAQYSKGTGVMITIVTANMESPPYAYHNMQIVNYISHWPMTLIHTHSSLWYLHSITDESVLYFFIFLSTQQAVLAYSLPVICLRTMSDSSTGTA